MIKVKALEWEAGFDDTEFYAEIYGVSKMFNGRWFVLRSGVFRIGEPEGFESLDDAKAACQAHHEQHVLSMITEVADGAE